MRKLTLFALALLAYFSASAPTHAQVINHAVLQQYIDLALKQNPDVKAELARWDQAASTVDQANAHLWPTLDLSMQYMKFEGGRIVDFGGQKLAVSEFGVNPWDNKIQAVWPIFNSAVWYGTKATHAYRDAATARLNQTKLDIALDVVEAYYRYAKASELVAIRESALKLATENHSTSQALFAAGKAQKNDVLRTEVVVASAEGDLLDAKNQQSLTKSAFNNLLHRNFDEAIELPSTTAMNSNAVPPALDTSRSESAFVAAVQDDMQQALAHRPEFQALENSERAYEGYRAVSASDYFPNVALYATYGFQENQLKFDTQQDYLAAGFQLQWNLFDGFGTNAKVSENDAQIAEITYQRESLVGAVRLQLVNARQSLESAKERQSIALRQRAAAEENYRVTKEQYDAGLAPLITMIDAETTLATARAGVTTSAYDELTAEAQYQRALGNQP